MSKTLRTTRIPVETHIIHEVVESAGTDGDARTPRHVALFEARHVVDTGAALAPGTRNAFIFPVPCMPGSLSLANILPTADWAAVIRNVGVQAIAGLEHRPGKKACSEHYSIDPSRVKSQAFVCDDIASFETSIGRLPVAERPSYDAAALDEFFRSYPDNSFIIVLFGGTVEKEDVRVAYWYRPGCPGNLFLPASSGVVGAAQVSVRQIPAATLIVSSTEMANGAGIVIDQDGADATTATFVPRTVLAEHVPNGLPAGRDAYYRVSDVHAGRYEAIVMGAPALSVARSTLKRSPSDVRLDRIVTCA